MITPLGGKTSLGTSAVVAAELATFAAYREAIRGVLARHGAINTEEAARDLRRVIAEAMPDVGKVMDQMGFSR